MPRKSNKPKGVDTTLPNATPQGLGEASPTKPGEVTKQDMGNGITREDY